MIAGGRLAAGNPPKLSKQLQFGRISAELGRGILGGSRVGIAARRNRID
jgi:hypothetical protein